MKLLAFGEVLWDVYPNDRFIGGATLNFAAHCAKHNAQAYLLSAVGNDRLGQDTLAVVRSHKLHTDYVSVLENIPTGQCLVTLDENSIPSYNLLKDVAWDCIDCQTAAKGSFDVLYFGTLSLRSEQNLQNLQMLLRTSRFQDVFVDVNIRPPFYSEKSIRFAMENGTIVKISDEELPVVAKALGIPCSQNQAENARLLMAQFPNIRLLLITLGSKGALAMDAQGRLYEQSAFPAQPVSTVGAGDSFGAAFLVKLFEGASIGYCLEYAAKVAAFVVSRYDAVPDYDPAALA